VLYSSSDSHSCFVYSLQFLCISLKQLPKTSKSNNRSFQDLNSPSCTLGPSETSLSTTHEHLWATEAAVEGAAFSHRITEIPRLNFGPTISSRKFLVAFLRT